MKKIILASHNPVKARAALGAFRTLFPELELRLESVSVESGVSDQPGTCAETREGALRRSANARDAAPDADYWVGIEGGVEELGSGLIAFAWIVVRDAERIGQARSATFPLPPRVTELIREGKELGEADDIVFGKTNSKQEEGAVGILTDGIIDREQLYTHAATLALIPFLKKDLY